MRFMSRLTFFFVLSILIVIPVKSSCSDSSPFQAPKPKITRTKSKRSNIKSLRKKEEADFQRHDVEMRRQQFQQMQEAQQRGVQQMQQYKRDSAAKNVN